MKTSLALAVLAASALLALAGCSGSGSGTAASLPPSNGSATPNPTGSGLVGGSGGASSGPSNGSATAGSGTSGPSVVHQKLHNFKIADVTFVGSREWALGSADCLGGSGTCDAIEYSSNSGRTWQSAPAPRANTRVPADASACKAPCVQHIRFASSTVGYAFSGAAASASDSGALFMTTNGGRTWHRQPGDADALEALDGTVLRVSDKGRGCPPGCTYVVQQAAIGSTHWHTVSLPGGTGGDGVSLARAGGASYLMTTQNPAGGGEHEDATLWSRKDTDSTWRNEGEPCPHSPGREVDAYLLAAAPDGSATVLCNPRIRSSGPFTATATGPHTSFVTGSRTALGSANITALGAASRNVVFVSSDDTYRSSNAGRSYARLAANAGSSPGQLSWIGFGSQQVGHGVATDARSLWTTTDGGITWHRHRFS